MRKASLLVLISVFLAGFALGGQAIANWSAPATWSSSRSQGGLMTMGDVTNPLPFVGLAPCRIVDTRGNGAPIQGGIFTGGSDVRNYTIPPICGVPGGTAAVSLNFTVTGPGQTMAGFLLAWPTGGAVPPVSILNWDRPQQQIANAAVVPTNGSGSITVNVSSPTHIIVDINGYYASGSPTPHTFEWDTPGSGAIAIFGYSFAGSGLNRGVRGEADSTTNGSAGVQGIAGAFNAATYGVQGISGSGQDAAGVYGVDGNGAPTGNTGQFSAGIRGESKGSVGVLGLSEDFIAVEGLLLNSAGILVARGALGSAFGIAFDSTGPPWGVIAFGNLGATGAKHFVEPHPVDPSKVILYSSLEGREVGTYFRGTAHTTGRKAVIEVPEDFRIVTDEEDLTVQLTPVGPLTTMSVESEDLNRIVVRSSQEVTFHYLVQGVRRAFKDFEPVARSMEFAPRSAEERMPAYLTEEAKRRLIANGTYNTDGTVNMETAERLRWAKAWKEREEQAKATAAANAAAHAARLAERK